MLLHPGGRTKMTMSTEVASYRVILDNWQAAILLGVSSSDAVCLRKHALCHKTTAARTLSWGATMRVSAYMAFDAQHFDGFTRRMYHAALFRTRRRSCDGVRQQNLHGPRQRVFERTEVLPIAVKRRRLSLPGPK